MAASTSTSLGQSSNGFYDASTNNGSPSGVDGPSERLTSPPYPIPLRGIRIKIRTYEFTSKQVRKKPRSKKTSHRIDPLVAILPDYLAIHASADSALCVDWETLVASIELATLILSDLPKVAILRGPRTLSTPRWGLSAYASSQTLRARSCRHFFSGLTEYAFQTRLGVADPPLVEYLGQISGPLLPHRHYFSVRSLTGRRLDAVAEMLAEANARVGEAKRQVHRHIGDFTLFWSGVYPEALGHLQHGTRKDFFLDYCEHGKRAYYIASTIPTTHSEADRENAFLERLSHDFELSSTASAK